MPKPVSTMATVSIAAPLRRVFDAARGLDIPATMRQHGPLPGVKTVEGFTGPYSAPGQIRRMTLTDGSSVREELTAYTAEKSYAYRIDGFTSAFASLVERGEAEWRFAGNRPGETRIEWTYALTPKSAAAVPAVWLIVSVLWPGYMRAALTRLKDEIEKAA